MFLLKKQKGVSLVEVLVSVTIMIIVSFLVIDTFYQARLSFNSSVENLDFYKKSVESRAIFTNLVDNAYITGNATYSIFKKRNNAIGSTPVVNPFDYPLIYAQPAPLVASSNFPSDAQQGTDVLVVQTIDFPIALEKAVSSSDQSITFDKVYAGSNQYMMLTDDTNQSLLETSSVHVNIDSGSTTFNLEAPIGQSYPVGSTLYTRYTIKVIYIRNTGQVDNNGNPEFELFQRSYSNSTNETEQALLKGVSDLHISYKMSGQNQQWQAVTSQTNKRSWYREIRGIKIDYKLDGQDQEVVLSFNGISN